MFRTSVTRPEDLKAEHGGYLINRLLLQSAPSVSPYNLQEYVYPDARDRQYLLFFHKGVKRTRFDIEKYNKLKDDIAEVQSLGESWMFCGVK